MVPELPIIFVTNLKGKAQLDVVKGVVFMDSRLKTWPQLPFQFIKFHELYHMYYDNPESERVLKIEMLCDMGAADELVKRGYSRTLIVGAMDQALTDSPEKKLRIANIKHYLSWMQH